MSYYLSKLLRKKQKNNQTMIDKLQTAMNHHPNADTSFSSYTSEHDIGSYIASEEDNASIVSEIDAQASKFLNITSIVNDPGRSTQENLLQNMKGIILSFADGASLSRKKNFRLLKIQDKVAKSISMESFMPYIRQVQKIMIKMEQRRDAELQERINKDASLERKMTRCSQSIPQKLFDPDYRFDWNNITKSNWLVIFERHFDHLDLVDTTLQFNINCKFERYIEAMSNLQDIENIISKQYKQVNELRISIQTCETNVQYIVNRILVRKKRFENLKKYQEIINEMYQLRNKLSDISNYSRKNKFVIALQMISEVKQKLEYFEKLRLKLAVSIHLKINEYKRQILDSASNHCIAMINSLLCLTLHFEQNHDVKNYQVAQNQADMSVLGHSYLNISLDISLVDRRDLDKLVPIQISESLTLPVNKVKELVALLSCFFEVERLDLRELYNEIYKVSRRQLSYLQTVIQETIKNYSEPSTIISGLAVLENILSRFVIFSEKLVSNLSIGLFEKFYEVINSLKNEEDRKCYLKAIWDVFTTIYSMIVDVLIMLKQTFSLLDHENFFEKFSSVDLEDYLSLYEFFWAKFFDLKVILSIDIDSSKINPELYEEIAKVFGGICAILQDKDLYFDFELRKKEILLNHLNRTFNREIQSINQNMDLEIWNAIDIEYRLQEKLNLIIFDTNHYQENEMTDELQLDGTYLNVTQLLIGSSPVQHKDSSIIVIKKEIHIGDAKFQITNSFSKLVECLQQCLRMYELYSQYKSEQQVIKKTLEVITMYNSKSTQMVLSGGCIILNLVKEITPQIFCISLLEIMLLEIIMRSLRKKFQLGEGEGSWSNTDKTQIEKMFSLIENDLRNHEFTSTNSMSAMFLKSCYNDIKGVLTIGWTDLRTNISLPTQHTSQILSKFKHLYREIEDMLPEESRFTLFSKIFDNLNNHYIELLIEKIESQLEALHRSNLLNEENKIYKRLADEFGYFINSIDEMGVFNQLEEFLAMRSRLREIQDIINEDR